jgi:hypothetical protein
MCLDLRHMQLPLSLDPLIPRLASKLPRLASKLLQGTQHRWPLTGGAHGRVEFAPATDRGLGGGGGAAAGTWGAGAGGAEESLRTGFAALPRAARAIPPEVFELFPVLRQLMRRRRGDLSGGASSSSSRSPAPL